MLKSPVRPALGARTPSLVGHLSCVELGMCLFVGRTRREVSMKLGDVPATSRRERQILDVLHRLGRGSVLDVQRQLPDPPSYSGVRTLLGVMEAKGLVTHAVKGKAFIYSPASSPVVARRS